MEQRCLLTAAQQVNQPATCPDFARTDLPSAVQGSRLQAAVLAKNAVGSSWRKTLGSREWSRVPNEERQVPICCNCRYQAMPLSLAVARLLK